MNHALSPRLADFVASLPLTDGMRVLEIGGAPGAAARAIAARIGRGHVHLIDRSAKGIEATRRAAAAEISAGILSTECVAVEDYEHPDGEPRFDLALAIRVGVLDGRHPAAQQLALARIKAALTPGGRLVLDSNAPRPAADL